jgi:hypothetical protein
MLTTLIKQQALEITQRKVSTHEILLDIIEEVRSIVHREHRSIIGIVDTQHHIAYTDNRNLTFESLTFTTQRVLTTYILIGRHRLTSSEIVLDKIIIKECSIEQNTSLSINP